MAKLMRCHTPHWQGNKFVDAGTVLPDGDSGVIPIYFDAFTVDEPKPEPAVEVKRGPGRPLGSKNKPKDAGAA